MLFRIVPSISIDGCSLTTGLKDVPLLTGWARICCSNWLAPGTTLPQLYCMGGALWKTASTFSGVLWRPWLSISCPQKVIFSLKNSHFVLFALNPWVCKLRKTSFGFARCSSSFFPVMIITSRIQLILDVPSNTWSMGRCQGVDNEVFLWIFFHL